MKLANLPILLATIALYGVPASSSRPTATGEGSKLAAECASNPALFNPTSLDFPKIKSYVVIP